MFLFLIAFEYRPTSQFKFNFNEKNCSNFNQTECNFCGPGTIFNISKFNSNKIAKKIIKMLLFILVFLFALINQPVKSITNDSKKKY